MGQVWDKRLQFYGNLYLASNSLVSGSNGTDASTERKRFARGAATVESGYGMVSATNKLWTEKNRRQKINFT